MDRFPIWGIIGLGRLLPLLGALSIGAAETPESPPSLAFWDKSLNLRVGGGYNDNVTLAHSAPEASAFVNTGLDAMIFRLPTDGTELYFFLNADDTRFFSSPSVNKEQILIAQAQALHSFTPKWKGGLQLEYIYQDQVFDASTADFFSSVRAQGSGITGRPSVRWDMAPKYWLEVVGIATRQLFTEPLDGYWEGGPRMTFGHEYGSRSELHLSYEYTRRVYDTREDLTLDGTPIPGTTLEFGRHAFQLLSRHYWDSERRWRSSSRLDLELNFDNGSGYYNYHKYQFSEQLRYRTKTWEISGQAKVNYYDYDLQDVSPTDTDKRHRLGLILNLRAERNLFRHFKAFAQFEYERFLSNVPSDEYNVTTFSVGIDWEAL